MNKQQMSPDESAASLALATRLSEQLMPKSPQQQPQDAQTPQTAPGQEQTPQTQETSPEPEPKENEQITTLTKDMSEFKGKIEGLIESKFDELTKTIKDAIS